MTMGSNGFSLERKTLIAHLAAIGNRIAKHNRRAGDTHTPMTISRISDFITECAREFDFSNDEQMLMLKFVVSECTTVKELFKHIGEDDCE